MDENQRQTRQERLHGSIQKKINNFFCQLLCTAKGINLNDVGISCNERRAPLGLVVKV